MRFELHQSQEAQQEDTPRKPWPGNMSQLLADPTAFDEDPTGLFDPYIYSWDKFMDCVADFRTQDELPAVFEIVMTRDSETVGSGHFGHAGEFYDVIIGLYHLAGRAAPCLQLHRRFTIRITVTNRDPTIEPPGQFLWGSQPHPDPPAPPVTMASTRATPSKPTRKRQKTTRPSAETPPTAPPTPSSDADRLSKPPAITLWDIWHTDYE